MSVYSNRYTRRPGSTWVYIQLGARGSQSVKHNFEFNFQPNGKSFACLYVYVCSDIAMQFSSLFFTCYNEQVYKSIMQSR